MALNTRRTGNAEYGRFIKALICGEPGSGKTLISSTFPNPYYASAEGGLMSVADLHLPYLEVQSSEELFELKSYLELPPDARESMIGCKVETVVLDTIDEIQGMLINERLTAKNQTSLTLQDFGWLSEQMQTLIRGFRNLNMHVVFTCHLKEVRDDSVGAVTYKPGMQGQISDKMPGFVDLSLLLTSHLSSEIVGTELKPVLKRQLQTFPDQQHPWIKDRSGKLPIDFPVNFEDDFARMNDYIFKNVNVGASETVTPVVAKTVLPELVEEEHVTTSSEVNAMTAQIQVEDPGSPEVSTFVCESCGTNFEDSDQAELSKLRRRKILCSPCYKASK